MSGHKLSSKAVFSWLWKHTSSGVAIVLIVGSLVLGYRLGHAGSPPAPMRDTHEHSAHAHGEPSGPQMYTCSMHPWVRLEDPNAKCPICSMSLIPVDDSNATSDPANTLQISLSPDAKKLARIETARARRFFPIAQTRLFGKVTLDQTSVSRITAYFPGRIEQLFVNYLGVSVSKGDHVAEVYSPELLAAFEELRQAKLASAQSDQASNLVRRATYDTLVASREKLHLYGLTASQIGAIEDNSFDSEYLTVFSPRAGVVTHLAVREGDYVQTGDPIATVADLSRVWLDLQAYESQLSMLRWGQRVTFTVEAHPGETFEGRITFIEPMIDDRTRTAAVRVAVENRDGHLKPGMFSSATVRTKMSADGAVVGDELAGRWVGPMHPTVVKDGPGICDVCGMDLVPAESLGVVGDPSKVAMPLVIPRSAILFTGTRSVVYVESQQADEPTYQSRVVTLGPRAGEYYIVRSGLDEGESVVVRGAFRIDSAMQIEAKPSMMMHDGGGGGNPHAGHVSMDMAVSKVEFQPDPANEIAATRPRPPEAFTASLSPIYSAYLDAQEALAGDDLDAFVEAAAVLKLAAAKVQATGLAGEDLFEWRRAAAVLTDDSPTATIAIARQHFESLSTAMISLERAFGHRGSDSLSVAFCPMAFDMKGARWIQRGSELKNPYFGAKMLTCGEVLETLAPTAPPSADLPSHGGHEHE